MQPSGKTDQMMADTGLRQSIRHNWFYMFFAFGTIITMNRVLGYYRLNVFGNIFNNAFALTLTPLQRTAAIRTLIQPMFLMLIDMLRLLAAVAIMALLSTTSLTTPGSAWLGIDRPLTRRRRRSDLITDVVLLGLQLLNLRSLLRNPLNRSQQRQLNDLWSQLVKLKSLSLIELPTQGCCDNLLYLRRIYFCFAHAHGITQSRIARKFYFYKTLQFVACNWMLTKK